MARRRMFSLDVVDTDQFLDLPAGAQLLYFHLGMRADDDGFVASPKKIMTLIGSKADELRVLAMRGYVIPFESGVVVIADWKSNNSIQKDRYRPTKYAHEAASLIEVGGHYCLDTDRIQDVSKMYTQVRIGKDRIGKDRVGKDRTGKKDNLKAVVDGVEDDELKDALNDFIDMRKKIKKPLTERALKIILTKLDDLAADPHTKAEILLQSVEHCWQTVYELKKEEPKKKSIIDEWMDA